MKSKRITPLHRLCVRVGLAAAVLAGCASIAPEVATWNIPSAGSTWQVAQRNTGSYGKDVQFRVSRGEGVWQGTPVVTLTNSATGMTIMARRDGGGWMAITGADGKPVTTFDPPVGFQYPLKVGKTWSTHHRMTTIANGYVTEFDYPCKVEAFEQVSVQAGTFDAFKVVCRTPGSEDTFWSSPDFGMLLKSDLRRNADHPMGPGTQRAELLALNLRK